jgi:ATP-dependent protease ClpP protease subunit
MTDKKRRHEETVSHYHDEYDKAIFIAGEKEIHFNAQIDGETISRIKKLISLIVDDNKECLIKRPNESESHVSLPDDKKTSGKKVKDPDVVITYIVNSPGGSVIDILDFVDYIQLLRKTYLNIKFTSIITGMCASAATIMCVIADKKQMTRFAFAMIHELSTGLNRSNYTKVINHGSFIKSMHNHLLTIYNEFRGIGMDNQAEIAKIEDMMLRETWMTADEYLRHGFVEEIL